MPSHKPYKWNLKKIEALATQRGGNCLSKAYKNPREKLIWTCKTGHVWLATLDSVRRGSWCLKCRKNNPLSIKDLEYTAKKRGGKLISKAYKNAQQKLKWQCEHDHQWLASANNVRNGRWCPICAGHKKKDQQLEKMRELAKQFGGKCLSTSYKSTRSKLKWECSKRHIWDATPELIRMGYWCRLCSGKNPKLTIQAMHDMANSRGGKCLEEKYKNDSTKMSWECGLGHQWDATANNIRHGRWCPICASGKMERISRSIFEACFNKPFPSVWPKWLVNERGNVMQLDGYNVTLSLAFEYQGVQHYEISRYTKTERDLARRETDDRKKLLICKERGITLIQIPYKKAETNIIGFLKKEFKKQNIDVAIPPLDEIDLSSAYSPNPLEEYKTIAEAKNGKCLSRNYVSAKNPLQWQCEKGHIWKTAPTNIKSGSWCPQCAGVAPVSHSDAIDLANSRNGAFLSNQFCTVNDKYRWRCSKGHEWKTTYSSIKSGTWCPTCSRKKYLNIEIIKELAGQKGGVCLSRNYVNSKTKLRFKCSKGHEFLSTSDKLIQGRWCPECANSRRGASQRLSIELMKEIAGKRGGKCLSQVYVNARTKLIWQCSEGHKWEAVPYTVKKGSWCSVCSRKRKGKSEVPIGRYSSKE